MTGIYMNIVYCSLGTVVYGMLIFLSMTNVSI